MLTWWSRPRKLVLGKCVPVLNGEVALIMRTVCEMFRLKGCVSCGGDLGLSYEDWQCLQSGSFDYLEKY